MVTVELFWAQDGSWQHTTKQMADAPISGLVLRFGNGTDWEVRRDLPVVYDFTANKYLAAIRPLGPAPQLNKAEWKSIAAPAWWANR